MLRWVPLTCRRRRGEGWRDWYDALELLTIASSVNRRRYRTRDRSGGHDEPNAPAPDLVRAYDPNPGPCSNASTTSLCGMNRQWLPQLPPCKRARLRGRLCGAVTRRLLLEPEASAPVRGRSLPLGVLRDAAYQTIASKHGRRAAVLYTEAQSSTRATSGARSFARRVESAAKHRRPTSPPQLPPHLADQRADDVAILTLRFADGANLHVIVDTTARPGRCAAERACVNEVRFKRSVGRRTRSEPQARDTRCLRAFKRRTGVLLDLGGRVCRFDGSDRAAAIRAMQQGANYTIAILIEAPQFLRLVQYAWPGDAFKVFQERDEALRYLSQCAYLMAARVASLPSRGRVPSRRYAARCGHSWKRWPLTARLSTHHDAAARLWPMLPSMRTRKKRPPPPDVELLVVSIAENSVWRSRTAAASSNDRRCRTRLGLRIICAIAHQIQSRLPWNTCPDAFPGPPVKS